MFNACLSPENIAVAVGDEILKSRGARGNFAPKIEISGNVSITRLKAARHASQVELSRAAIAE